MSVVMTVVVVIRWWRWVLVEVGVGGGDDDRSVDGVNDKVVMEGYGGSYHDKVVAVMVVAVEVVSWQWL